MSRPSLLLLGGSRQQVVAIEKARELGYRTVLCDYLPDNPGRLAANTFYPVSTTDREAVLEVAHSERVSGILAYSSDPAGPTAAYVAEELGLPTNPLASVEALSIKTLFRHRMEEAGVPVPGSRAMHAGATAAEILASVEGLSFPLIVKPTDSSGSKGVTVVYAPEELLEAYSHAAAFGRNGILIAEEWVENALPSVVGGDVFVVGGEVRLWGLMSCLRDAATPLVPIGKKTPSGLLPSQTQQVKAVIQRLVDSFGLRFGELNVEVMMDVDGNPYVIELGSRAGGNMIPVQLSDASGVDLVAANVLCAMGEDPNIPSWDSGEGPCIATHVLHAGRDGIYGGFELSPEAEATCYRMVEYLRPGDPCRRFDGADKALGILFFKFGCQQEMDDFCDRIGQHVTVAVS